MAEQSQLSSKRKSIEHMVGKPPMLFKQTHHLCLQDQTPIKVIQTSIILTNINRHQTSYFFDCYAPLLSKYLAGQPTNCDAAVDKRTDMNGDGSLGVEP
eukprot:m.15190 g.15190  ORF g.15190 m.15190 type:complete len:99 (-) comp10430_c0_seq2:42-338(-)